jgi:hypothetical protein
MEKKLLAKIEDLIGLRLKKRRKICINFEKKVFS